MLDYAEDRLFGHGNASYDAAAKSFLSKRKILAWILKRVVPEFKEATLEDIAERYIEGNPMVGQIPVSREYTNVVRKMLDGKTENIRGERTEETSITEGKITFDVLFKAVTPDTGEQVALYINIEAQKDIHPGYSLLKRAVYYGSRLISSQKTIDFEKTDYDKIKTVYTIFICMGSPEKRSIINRYSLQEDHLLGNHHADEKEYKLMNFVMIYLGDQASRDRLIELLRLVFRVDKSFDEIKKTLQSAYDIQLTGDMEKELRTMCNLSEGIYDRAFEAGEMKNMIEMIKTAMESQKWSLQKAMDVFKLSPEKQSIVKGALVK